jgi:hypothetical protein
MFSKLAIGIFQESIVKYHIKDDVYQSFSNPYEMDSIEHLLYRKNWIDTVQWHYEEIDASNQDRTDLVEFIDSYFLNKYQSVEIKINATVNTESPAWAIDRLSILALKIYHMNEEVIRTDASLQHLKKCKTKLAILLEQRVELSTAIDQLLTDIESGNKYMKVYKQMKMYNDDELNPVLRKTTKD